jgi:hypothetical protein
VAQTLQILALWQQSGCSLPSCPSLQCSQQAEVGCRRVGDAQGNRTTRPQQPHLRYGQIFPKIVQTPCAAQCGRALYLQANPSSPIFPLRPSIKAPTLTMVSVFWVSAGYWGTACLTCEHVGVSLVPRQVFHSKAT